MIYFDFKISFTYTLRYYLLKMIKMNITIRQLQIFDQVAKTESYTRTAEILNMTQPAVSMQIKELEAQINIPLFERHGKKMMLTHTGQGMLKYATKLLTEYQNMQVAIDELQSTHEQYIKVSAATTANHLITYMIADFSKTHQKVKIALDITNRESLVKQLNHYEPDFVVMGEPPKSSLARLNTQKIIENPLVMVSAPNHPFAHRKNILLKEVINENFIVREKGSGTKAAIERHFKEHHLSFQSSFEMSSNEAIKNSVIAGLGLGIVSLHTIKSELAAQDLVILNIESLPIIRHWHLVSRKGRHLSPIAKEFSQHILQQAARYTTDYPELGVK